jgi:hypothetical protein
MDEAHRLIQAQVDRCIRRLLSEQNRDVSTRTYGCFDRRYWAWKLIDYPEATFQRNVYPLAWSITRQDNSPYREHLRRAARAGLLFAADIQHKDGSFDQAFPHEHSYGATAFLLHPLIEAYTMVKDEFDAQEQDRLENCLNRAAVFLDRNNETHGTITNHLCGAALSLLSAGDVLGANQFVKQGDQLLAHILSTQEPEGWFPEYEGADPGYQTLGLYYLAQIYCRQPEAQLGRALEKSLEFLSYFIHPDGSFAGHYGSRRTSVFYPGGFALLKNEFPLAATMLNRMLRSIAAQQTVTLDDIDIGNMAPLLSNYLPVIDRGFNPIKANLGDALPCDLDRLTIDFDRAGLSVRSTPTYYAVVGISNGGVTRVFRRSDGRMIWDDSGYWGRERDGQKVTSQVTELDRKVEKTGNSLIIETPLYRMGDRNMSPFELVVMRLLNLTIMRNIFLGNVVKGLLVRLLIRGKQAVPLQLKREIHFHEEAVEIKDHISKTGSIQLSDLSYGFSFVSIHMASARYFDQPGVGILQPIAVDVQQLEKDGQIECRQVMP